jgi:hypothetical protein
MFRWVYDLTNNSELLWLNALNDGKSVLHRIDARWRLTVKPGGAFFFFESASQHVVKTRSGHFRLWSKDSDIGHYGEVTVAST